MLSVKIVEKGDISENLEFVNDNKTNVNSCLLQKLKEPNGQWAGMGGEMQWLNFVIFFREREHLLSKIPENRTVDFRRSKKESCSMRRGLRVGTNLVEFRQLHEVWIFSYLC